MYRIVLMNGGLAEYEAVLKEFTSTEDNQVSFALFSTNNKYVIFLFSTVLMRASGLHLIRQ